MAKYIIKDLSAKQIEQVLVTTYHALSKPLLIYPSLDVLKTHVELKLDTSIIKNARKTRTSCWHSSS